MKKEDLKTGMLVRSDHRVDYIIFKDTDIRGENIPFVVYISDREGGQDNLEAICKAYNPIRKVYQPKDVHAFRHAMNQKLNIDEWLLVWDGKPEKTHIIDGIKYSESSLISIIKKAHK